MTTTPANVSTDRRGKRDIWGRTDRLEFFQQLAPQVNAAWQSVRTGFGGDFSPVSLGQVQQAFTDAWGSPAERLRAGSLGWNGRTSDGYQDLPDRIDAVISSMGRKASSLSSARATWMAVANVVMVVMRFSSPSAERSRMGTAKPRWSAPTG